jgi:hypothetical protein
MLPGAAFPALAAASASPHAFIVASFTASASRHRQSMSSIWLSIIHRMASRSGALGSMPLQGSPGSFAVVLIDQDVFFNLE